MNWVGAVLLIRLSRRCCDETLLAYPHGISLCIYTALHLPVLILHSRRPCCNCRSRNCAIAAVVFRQQDTLRLTHTYQRYRHADFSGCPTPQRITTYYLSPNRQRPLAGTFHAAFFNTFRRCRMQVLYVAPPFIAAYAAMNYAEEWYVCCPIPASGWSVARRALVTDCCRNEYLNSKPGRMAAGEE